MSTWFRPKMYGYGAAPANWKGWAATFAFIAVVAIVTVALLASQPNTLTDFTSWRFAAWAVIIAILTVGFVWLARAKTDGQWAWRWGK